MSYQPRTKKQLLDQGSCCYTPDRPGYCVNCPWLHKVKYDRVENMRLNKLIKFGLESGLDLVIGSPMMSLIPKVVLQDRLTLVYREKDYHGDNK